MAVSSEVDIEALRKKYNRPHDELRADAAASGQASATPRGSAATELKNPVLMCQQCQAHGVVKKQYGYRVIDEQCDKCGGEGVIVNRPKPASDELRKKISRVEALIEQVDSLEELERLEAALKARTLEALDGVLADAH